MKEVEHGWQILRVLQYISWRMYLSISLVGEYYSTQSPVLDVISCKILQNNNNWFTSVAQMLHLLWDRSQAIGRFPYYWEVLWILKSSCTGLVVVTWPARGQQEKKGTPGWRSWKVLQRIVKDLAKILDTSCEILPRFAKLCFFAIPRTCMILICKILTIF